MATALGTAADGPAAPGGFSGSRRPAFRWNSRSGRAAFPDWLDAPCGHAAGRTRPAAGCGRSGRHARRSGRCDQPFSRALAGQVPEWGERSVSLAGGNGFLGAGTFGTFGLMLAYEAGRGLGARPGVPGWGASGPGSVPWTIVVLLTLLTLLPALLLSMTPFVRLLVVFHFLRQALGLQSTPSNPTLIGLSLILTYFLMQPVVENIYNVAAVPLQAGSITAMEAAGRAGRPLRTFMLRYAREKDLALVLDLAHETRPRRPEDLPLRVLVPAYIISELN